MKILGRLIFKEHLNNFLVTYFIFFTITLSFDFIEKIDDIIKAKLNLQDSLIYYLYRSIYLHSEYSNYALLISALITLNMLSQRNELTALFTSAVSLKRILYLSLSFVAFAGILNFTFSAYVSPRFQLKSEQKINKGLLNTGNIDDLIFKKDFGFIFIDLVIPTENILLNAYIVEINPQTHSIEHITFARKIEYQGSSWTAFDVKKTNIIKKQVSFTDKIVLNELKNLEDLSPLPYKAEWLTINDNIKVIKGGLKSGININNYLYMLTRKLFSYISLILLFLLSFPMGIQLGRTKKNVEVLFLSIVMFAGYAVIEMVVFRISRSANLSFAVPPIILSGLILSLTYLFWKTHFFWWGDKKDPLKVKYQKQ